MKILFIDNYYPKFLNHIETKLKSENINSYKLIKEKIYDFCFGTSDYYSRNLKLLGVEAEDVIINSKLLQKSWSNKHYPFLNIISYFVEKLPKLKDIYNKVGNPLVLIEQVKEYKPDIVYIQCIGALPPIMTKIIKCQCKYLVGQIASLFPPESYFRNYDLVLSSLPNMVETIRKMGIKSEYFPIGFETTVLDKLDNGESYGVTHIGGYGPIHNERNEILEYAAEKVNIDFWGYGTENLKKNSPILSNYHGEAWGIEMYRILKGSKITLTGHITKVAGQYANNMTLFEATGCGTLLITDHKSNLHDLFEIDKEIVTYKTPEELVEKIKYFLNHEEDRKKIALAGQKRTLRDHTYRIRMKELIDILDRYF